MRRQELQPEIDQELKRQILSMRDQDQDMLKGEYDNSVIRKNTEEAKHILRQYGWPGRTLIGDSGSDAFWLLVQHSDHDVEFQKEALDLLRLAVEKGEASKRNLAYLTDRVRVNSGEPQLFGTQLESDELKPKPIEEPEKLEQRRKEFGMEPFEEYKERMREIREKTNTK